MRKALHERLLYSVSKPFDHRARFRPLQKRQKRLGGLIVGPVLQKHGILKNGRMELVRHDPPRTPLDAVKLGQRDEAQLGIARIDELKRLGNATALDALQPKLVQGSSIAQAFQ